MIKRFSIKEKKKKRKTQIQNRQPQSKRILNINKIHIKDRT